MATKKIAPKPLGLPQPPVIGFSGGASEAPTRTRVGSKYQPRPKVDFGKGNPSKTGNSFGEGETTTQAPLGLKAPEAIKRSGHKAGGDNDKPMARHEGTGHRALQTFPELDKKTEPKPHGLEMPSVVPHSDESIRSTSLGGKPLRWNKRGYKMPTGVETLDE